MFKHLLVPLDGSRLAEAALAPAAQLARCVGAAITLIHVLERSAPSEVHSQHHLASASEASPYLDEVASRPLFAGLTVTTHVHTAEVNDVARSITEHTAELAPDLVVMTTHGRDDARRLIFGSIAQQVIAMGRTPVLMVRPVEGETAAPDVRSGDWGLILAPVDGNPAHERGLAVAAELAAAFHCRIHLLMVIPKLRDLRKSEAAASRVLPGATRFKLEMESEGARDYLDARVRELAARGVETSAESLRGDPARLIERAARRIGADLLVLGTHGRAGTEAFWSESVAARVVERTTLPLLLVPLKQ